MTTTTASLSRSGWAFWAGWALAFVGFPLGGLAARALVGDVDTPLEGVVAGATTGAVIGALQWLAARRRLAPSPWWIAVSSLGLAGGLGLGILIVGTETGSPALQWRALITGLVLGAAQGWALRRRPKASILWAIVVALGWVLGWTITAAVGVDLELDWSVFGSTGAWSFQLVTGLALLWLLRREVDAAPAG